MQDVASASQGYILLEPIRGYLSMKPTCLQAVKVIDANSCPWPSLLDAWFILCIIATQFEWNSDISVQTMNPLYQCFSTGGS